MKTALRLGSGLALLLLLVVAALWVRRGAPDEAAPSRTAPGSDAAPPPSLAARKTAVDRIPRRPGVHQVVPGDRPSAPDEIVRIPLGPLPDGSVADGTVSALEDTVKRRGGTYAYNSRGYGATFGEEGPDVLFEAPAEGLGHPTFAYRLREARLGNRVIAAAGPARAYVDPAERAVAYDRGRLEERYVLNPDSLEQIFVVWSLPEERGDLTLAGRVATNAAPPPDGASSRLSFTHEGREVAYVADALVFDAAGRRLPLDLVWSAGELSMTVPAWWMAEAVAPVVVDPLVGSPLTVDAGAPEIVQTVNTHKVRVADVAHGATAGEYLVVWQERNGSSAFNYDVFGQRVSSAGTLVGSAIPIATSPAGEYECAVAYAPSVNRFLVTWRHDPADNASADDQRIEGRVVNADGTFYTAAFTVADKTGQDFGPSIAFDGTQWFVAYTNVVSPADSNVCGRFVSGAGVPGTAVDIDAATDYAALPSVSFANGVYLAAWEKGTTTSRGVSCRKMTAAGAFPAAIAAVEPSANTPSEPDVSGGTTRFIVAWRRTSNNDVNARLVTADAATATAFPVATFNLRTGATARETPRAAFATTPGQWYVAFADAATTSTDVYGVRVTTAGAPSPVDQLTNTSSKEWRPELAYNAAANEALVVYLKNAAAPYQVLCRRWSFGNGPQAPASLTATPGVGQISLSWSAVAGAASYTVKRATTWGGPYAVIASNVVAFGYVDAGLGNNQTRYYVVSSVGSAGEGPETAPVSAKTLGVPPAPGSLTATAESTTSIRLSWPDVAGEERYEVLDGQNVVVATLPADTTSWTETNLVENTPYPRKVRGVNGVGTGGTTALVTRYTLVRQASGQHATIVANAEAVDIQAAKPPNFDKGQTGCRMIKYDAGTSTWVTLKDFDVQYMGRDTPVGSGGTKYYAFVYRNGDGIWNPSYSETFTIAVPWSSSPPPAPKNLAAAAASGSATLTWDPTPGAYYFTLKRATSPSGPWTVVAQDLIPSFYQNTYVNSGLTNLTTYYYVVTARNYGGESGPSNQASVTPGAPTVTVEVPDGSASEAGDAGQFLIRRTGDTSFSLQVFFTVSGTASSGADYTALSTSVTLAAGVATATLNVSPVDDPGYEPAETVYLLLSPGPKYVLGTPVSGTVVIADDEAPAAPPNVRTTAYHQTIDVEWDPSPSPELAGYNVYRKTGTSGTWALLNTTGVVKGTKYRDAPVANGTVFYYHVRAVRQ